MNWKVDRFDAKAWELIKETIKNDCLFNGTDFFGCIKCGALCFDIVLRDGRYSDGRPTEWFLSADAYLLGDDTGYGYTKRGTPYDEDDGFALEYDLEKGYDETLASFIEQINEAIQNNRKWTEYANKTDHVWEMEE